MDPQSASSLVCSTGTRKRARVPNFTAQEKAVLRYFIKRQPIIESKKTDNRSVEKKKLAWDSITTQFNANINVYERDTVTLKRAWDNMKATTRRARDAEQRNTLNTKGGTSSRPQPPQLGAIANTAESAEETDPLFFCKIENSYDSDSIHNNGDSGILNQIYDKLKPELSEAQEDSDSNLPLKTLEQGECEAPEKVSEDESADDIPERNIAVEHNARTPIDHVRREAVMRIKHFQSKQKMEMRTLKAKLKVQEIKTRAAKFEEETNKTNLEIAKLKLKDLKSRLQN